MKNKVSQNKELLVIKFIISMVMLILFGLTAYLTTDAFLSMLDPRMGSVLIRIKSLFNPASLFRMLTGSLFVAILSSALYILGMIFDWFVNIINNPKHQFVQAYFTITKIINRWYLIIAISIWALVALSDDAFNYFTILVSLIALLHEISSTSKSLHFKIISHSFIKDRNYLEEK